jgi:hypothetical protein
MRISKQTYYKALLLLIVFSLNTVVSFACSFGGVFHNFHHGGSAAIEHKESSNGKHDHGTAHKHDHSKRTEHDHETDPSGDKKDNCCSDEVTVLQKLDKSVSRNIDAPHLNFITVFIASYLELFSFHAGKQDFQPHKIRWRPPATIQDLRIVIQSFQI